MSVALENARLFAETQRLLNETQQRNAELAVINSVQQGLVAQLDMQGIYDLVGDKIRRNLRRPGGDHRPLRRPAPTWCASPTCWEMGRAHRHNIGARGAAPPSA